MVPLWPGCLELLQPHLTSEVGFRVINLKNKERLSFFIENHLDNWHHLCFSLNFLFTWVSNFPQMYTFRFIFFSLNWERADSGGNEIIKNRGKKVYEWSNIVTPIHTDRLLQRIIFFKHCFLLSLVASTGIPFLRGCKKVQKTKKKQATPGVCGVPLLN